MIFGFLFFIPTFLKHCKALSTEKYRRYINIIIIILLECVRHSDQEMNTISNPLSEMDIDSSGTMTSSNNRDPVRFEEENDYEEEI